jgi:predicted nucleotidyltransferase
VIHNQENWANKRLLYDIKLARLQNSQSSVFYTNCSIEHVTKKSHRKWMAISLCVKWFLVRFAKIQEWVTRAKETCLYLIRPYMTVIQNWISLAPFSPFSKYHLNSLRSGTRSTVCNQINKWCWQGKYHLGFIICAYIAITYILD